MGGTSSNCGVLLVVRPVNWPNRLSATISGQFSLDDVRVVPLGHAAPLPFVERNRTVRAAGFAA